MHAPAHCVEDWRDASRPQSMVDSFADITTFATLEHGLHAVMSAPR